MAKIGIYGGSFNPPHLGHILAAKEFQRVLELDQLLFVPAAIPPHKTLSPGSPDAQTRKHLLELAVADLPFARVDDRELHREGPSYTVDTLRELRATYPGDELILCMGTDMLLSFDSWHEPEKIAELAQIAMAHRLSSSPEKLREVQERFETKFHVSPILIQNDFVEVSSTQVRRLLILGGAEDFLPPAVLEEIHRLGLYGTRDNRKGLPFPELKEASLVLHKDTRKAHVVGVSETAKKLAERWGANPVDAERAGILHDVTKALDGPDQLRLCRKYGIVISDFERTHTKVLHARTGAAVAEQVFGENEAVCQAIRWHTSGKADMSLLEKIVYVADYMEPNRKLDGVEELRRLAFSDLDAALLMGLHMTADHLLEQKAEIGKDSLDAIEFLEQRKERNSHS